MSRTRDIATILSKTDAVNADNHALLNTSSGVDSAEVITLITANSTNLDSADMQTISDQVSGNRNLIINGNMSVAQRGTSYADPTDGTYGALDRFAFFNSNDGAYTVTQDTTVPSGEGFYYSMKFDCTSTDTSIAAGQYAGAYQKIEGTNNRILGYGAAGAKTITVSFWAKSNLTGPWCYSVRNSAVDRSFIKEFTLGATDTWERISFQVPGDTSGTWLATTGTGAVHMIALTMGSTFHGTNNTWQSGNKTTTSNQVNLLSNTSNELYITGWQVEIGDVATAFEHEDYVITLNKCLRYFYRLRKTNAWGEFCTIRTYSGDDGTGIIYFPQPMRAQPTLTIDKTVNSTNFAYDLNSISVAASDVNVTQIGIAAASSNGSAFVTSGGATIQTNGGSGAIDCSFDFSAEI